MRTWHCRGTLWVRVSDQLQLVLFMFTGATHIWPDLDPREPGPDCKAVLSVPSSHVKRKRNLKLRTTRCQRGFCSLLWQLFHLCEISSLRIYSVLIILCIKWQAKVSMLVLGTSLTWGLASRQDPWVSISQGPVVAKVKKQIDHVEIIRLTTAWLHTSEALSYANCRADNEQHTEALAAPLTCN